MDFILGKANAMAFKVLLLPLHLVCYHHIKKATASICQGRPLISRLDSRTNFLMKAKEMVVI
jgi:hypothetical protein